MILAFDTCFGAVSVALASAEAGDVILRAARFEPCRGGHAERLLPMIEAVLAEAALVPSRVDRVAVTLGPGTFTGVRTGIAAARAYALAAGVGVVGTTSLAVMAAGLAARAASDTGIAVAIDARKGQVFSQCFSASGAALDDVQLETPPDLARRLAGGRWRLAGSAAHAVAEAARADGVEIAVADALVEPDARHLAGLAPMLTPLLIVTPLYIRAPDAIPQSGKSLPRTAP